MKPTVGAAAANNNLLGLRSSSCMAKPPSRMLKTSSIYINYTLQPLIQKLLSLTVIIETVLIIDQSSLPNDLIVLPR
ncbi:hypothetical protein AQUCO_01800186v1 [Aquilegia coerulea]|uniref:Uncharacterized protein n=1 Tax=Aquilegia coerulea TaxID=218851 RepID=A0A2G5DKE4_AQUCA|nr:hypothetical protein AQUCO_01800186v1 [Aquilegia coerulea]